jgi:N-acetylmuramoyl-L-alanine amidase
MPVADGTPVEFSASTGEIRPRTAYTHDGEAVSYFSPKATKAQNKITVSASASERSHSLELEISPDAPEIVVAHIYDANTKARVANVLVSTALGPLVYSDRSGYFALSRRSIGDMPITISCPGYEPRQLNFTSSANLYAVELKPVAGGVLFNRMFAIDPQFGGEEKGSTGPTGTRASDLNMAVARYLAGFLRTAGAQVVLTRESDETVSPLRRVEIAEQFGAEWFISIGHGDARPADTPKTDNANESGVIGDASVLHYPTSQPGQRLAESIAKMLETNKDIENAVIQPDARFVLTHTSSPAVMVRGPIPSTLEMENKLRTPYAARNEAYAIYCGLLENFGLNEEGTGEMWIRVFDKDGNPVPNALLSLDSVLTLQTDMQGETSFHRLAPGQHTLEVFSGGTLIRSGAISLTAGQGIMVDISVTGSIFVSTRGVM